MLAIRITLKNGADYNVKVDISDRVLQEMLMDTKDDSTITIMHADTGFFFVRCSEIAAINVEGCDDD